MRDFEQSLIWEQRSLPENRPVGLALALKLRADRCRNPSQQGRGHHHPPTARPERPRQPLRKKASCCYLLNPGLLRRAAGLSAVLEVEEIGQQPHRYRRTYLLVVQGYHTVGSRLGGFARSSARTPEANEKVSRLYLECDKKQTSRRHPIRPT